MTIILFYISLVLIIAMLAKKHFGIEVFQHETLSTIVDKNEEHIHKIAKEGKELASKIHFKNFHRLTVMTANFVKRESIYLKRRFDSKQPKFLLKQGKEAHHGVHPVSFFLKSVSDYRNSLRKKD